MHKLNGMLKDIKVQLQELKNEENKEILRSFYDVIEILSDKIEEINVKQETIEENIQYLDEDLTSLQDEVFEEISLEDLEDMEEEYIEVKCSQCSNPLFVEKEVFDAKNEIPCPFCKNKIIF